MAVITQGEVAIFWRRPPAASWRRQGHLIYCSQLPDAQIAIACLRGTLSRGVFRSHQAESSPAVSAINKVLDHLSVNVQGHSRALNNKTDDIWLRIASIQVT